MRVDNQRNDLLNCNFDSSVILSREWVLCIGSVINLNLESLTMIKFEYKGTCFIFVE